MLQSFRDNLKGVVAAVLVALLAIPFVLTGVDYLFVSGSSVETAAEVNGEKISRLRLEQALVSEKTRMIDQNPDLDQALLDDDALRGPVLERLIGEKVVVLAARDVGMGVSQRTVGEALNQIDAFKTDGKFDRQRYQFAIRNQGYTSAAFVDLIKEDILRQQFANGLLVSGFVTAQDVNVLARFTEQTRDYQYLIIEAKPLREAIVPTEEQIQAHYDANAATYQTSEQVVVDYIELSPSMLEAQVEVSADEIQARFDQEAENVPVSESRRAAHILLNEDDEDALAEVQRKLSGGTDFAELANQYSQDTGSAEAGGDLGFTDGTAFPEEFESALASLNVGEVSEPVETENGVHLIKLLEIQKNSFELSKESDRIRAQLQAEKADRLMAEKLAQLKELSYNAESLQEVAEELQLTAKLSQSFSRNGGTGIAAYPAVLRAAFSDDVLNNSYASEVLDLGDQRHIVIKLKQHFLPRQRELAEVRQSIVNVLKNRQARDAINEQVASIKARAQAGESIESIAKDLDLQWQVALDVRQDATEVNPEIRNFVFRMPVPGDAPGIDGLFTSDGDYAVVSLREVTEGNPDSMDEQRRQGIRYSTLASNSSREMMAYEAHLLKEADIEE